MRNSQIKVQSRDHLAHLRARKLVRHARSVNSHRRAPATLVSTTMDFRAFVAKAPHLTIPRQRTLVYGGKLLFSNATAKIPMAISQKRHDGFSFLNDGNLDKCLSKKKILLSDPDWVFIIILCSQLTSLRQNILERRFAGCTSGLRVSNE